MLHTFDHLTQHFVKHFISGHAQKALLKFLKFVAVRRLSGDGNFCLNCLMDAFDEGLKSEDDCVLVHVSFYEMKQRPTKVRTIIRISIIMHWMQMSTKFNCI